MTMAMTNTCLKAPGRMVVRPVLARERELRLEAEKGRKDGEERGRERSNRDVAIMKEELARKSEEVFRQREEMSALVAR